MKQKNKKITQDYSEADTNKLQPKDKVNSKKYSRLSRERRGQHEIHALIGLKNHKLSALCFVSQKTHQFLTPVSYHTEIGKRAEKYR